ncbi:unnamed protein product [Rotaria sordida]|uniref:ADP ribosyltransferase domain-containing protein n=1 Tax=Rotaria sordida TaxID=392033 RepID=A0A819ULW8_9BILA|nr:unnamed protein product [Rotaria sordida]
MLQSDCDKLISIGIFILATKSLLTARTIAREAANNGLISILFQIETVQGIRLHEIDSNHVIFYPGTVFRLESTNEAPDNVWYVKIKPADSEFALIKEQVHFEVKVPLSWLTFGNYLYFLNRPSQAQTYFEYLLNKRPENNIDSSIIYNNMAIMYMMDSKEEMETKAMKADLHKKLNQLDTKQTNCIKPLIHEVYRGKLITGSVLQQLIDNEGRLIYVNGFLSTTIDRDVALAFSGNQENQDQGVKSILFLLKIDENAKQTYAYIADESVMKDELEVLFSLGTIWRIESITHDKSLCIIELTLCEELEPETTQLRAKYANENVTLLSLGDILLELGNEDEAKWCYREMLDKPCNDNETVGILYYRIGMLQLEKKLYDVALETLKKAAESLEKLETKRDEITLPGPLYIYDRRSPLLTIYYNMGLMYENKRKFDKAIDCYESATKEKGSSLERATVCDTLGVLYFCRGNYFKACEYHEHACQLIDDTYPEWKDFKDHLKRARDQLQNNPKTG